MKMKSIISAFFILLLLCNCSDVASITNNDYSDENEIVNLVFAETVGSDTVWKMELLPVRFLALENSSNDDAALEKYLTETDSLKTPLDTLTMHVFLNENFIAFPKHIEMQSILKSENYSANFSNVDSSFKPLIINLIESAESRKLDTAIIKTGSNYKIDYSGNRKKYPEDIFEIGYISITRATFNSDKTKACIYAEIRCGSECGGGAILFFKKVNGVWKIVGQKELWVS